MTLLPFAADRLRSVLKLAIVMLAVAVLTPVASAQNPSTDQKPPDQRTTDQRPAPETEETFTIRYATAPNDLNDLQTALRNMLPRARLYGVQSQNAIVVRATPEDIETAKRMIGELDHPQKAWRITYTLTETDNGKQVGVQHVALVVVSGNNSSIRQGNKVPLVTGMQKGSSADQNAQVQYIDVGLKIEAKIEGGRLRSRIEQSGISDEKSGFGAEDPVVRQTTLDGYSNLEPGKPEILGSLDIPGSTHRQKIEVSAEPLT